MLAETDLKRLFHKLIHQFSAKIHFAGSEIHVSFYDHASKVQLSTPVYLGTNYIPTSVRSCITQRPPFDNSLIRTNFTIDEDNYRILLNYTGALNRSDAEIFEDLVEKFGCLADEWRVLLDEKDKNDLIYIHTK